MNQKKQLVLPFGNTSYQFSAEQIEGQPNEPIRFRVNMNDSNPLVIEYKYESWEQVDGKQIYTDIMIGMGRIIERHFPEVFE